jgi:hypothetical protein
MLSHKGESNSASGAVGDNGAPLKEEKRRFFGRFEMVSVDYRSHSVGLTGTSQRRAPAQFMEALPANLVDVGTAPTSSPVALPPVAEVVQYRPTSSKVSSVDLEDLENRLIEALRLQREEELAVLRFQRWTNNALKNQINTAAEGSIRLSDRPHATPADLAATIAAQPAVQSSDLLHDLHWEDLKIGDKVGSGAFGDVFRSILWGQVRAFIVFMVSWTRSVIGACVVWVMIDLYLHPFFSVYLVCLLLSPLLVVPHLV